MGLNPFWRSIVIFMHLFFYEKFLQYLEVILHDYFVKMQEDWNKDAPSETISPIMNNSHANCFHKFKLFTKKWKFVRYMDRFVESDFNFVLFKKSPDDLSKNTFSVFFFVDLL